MKITDSMIDGVWEHGRVVPGHDPTLWRKDECGAWMHREAYGDEGSEFGWRVVPVRIGQPETVQDFRPFHRLNSYDRANGQAHCRVSAMPEGQANRLPE